MGSKGSQQTTQNQSQSYTPAGLGYMTGALNQAQNAAQLPFNLQAAPVAGFSPDQQSAFGNINAAQGMAQPYYDQAQQYFGPGGAQQFFNPYAGAVTSQLQNIFGQQNQQNTGNLVQSAGGVGADRIAVGQANMANQQGLAAGQIYSQLYGQAQQQAAQAGQNFANLGQQAQGSALQGAQAQLGTGALQQQLQQQQLNSPYQLSLAQAAFPYQQAQFNAGITGALAPGMGGTTTGNSVTNSQFNPSLIGQIGGGLSALGSLAYFAARGGRIPNPYAKGGAVPDQPIDVSAGYVPAGKLAAGSAHMPSLSFSAPGAMKPPDTGLAKALQGGMSLYNSMSTPAWGGGNPFSGDAYGGSGANPLPGLSALDYGAGYAPGGAVRNPYSYAGDDGEVTDEDRALGAQMLREGMGTRAPDSIPGGEPFRMPDQGAVDAWRNGTPAAPMAMADEDVSAPSPVARAAVPAALPQVPSRDTGSAGVGVAGGAPAPEGKSLAGFLKSPYSALLAGGLDAMATGSLAHGFGTGLTAYRGQQTAEQEAQRLMQEAEQHNQEVGLKQQALDIKKQAQTAEDQGTSDIVNPIVEAIKTGQQPPTTTGLYGKSAAVRAGLAKEGFDLAKAQVEWQRAQKQVATLNGPQMTRFVGLAGSVDKTIDEVKALADQMQNSGVPLLNRLKLQAYINTQGNSPNGQLAARYVASVNTLKEEFANLANGGYAPTEPAWKLANEQIDGNFGVKQLHASLDEVQRLIRYRVQGIPGLQQMGAGAPNRYTGQGAAPAMGAPAAAPAGPKFTGRTASGPGGAKLRETSTGEWVP